jgi:ABC-2 type transport system ATP-binding protein
MSAISCHNLTKKFRDTVVLDDITLDIDEALFFGILGDEGAGKTTLLKVVSGLVRPTSGTCHLFGKEVLKDQLTALQDVGCLVGEPAFYEYLTAGENLDYFGSLLHAESFPVMESLDISFRERYPSRLTTSMKYQLGIALALFGSPRLLLLDEPFTYLTDSARSPLYTLLKERVTEGMTVVFTTTRTGEIAGLASEGAILSQGKIISRGPSSQLDFPAKGEVGT